MAGTDARQPKHVIRPRQGRVGGARKRWEANDVKKLSKLVTVFATLSRRDQGQTMAEYGVVLALVALTVVATLTLLSGSITRALSAVAHALPG